MAGQDFYTMTPGSAVADTLQDILARRKAEARQAMLDKLNEQNMQHNWSNQDAQLALQNKQEGRLGENQTHDNLIADANFIPDTADPASLNPKLHDFLKGTGAIHTEPGVTPSVSSGYVDETGAEHQDSTVTLPKTPDREVYAGSKAYQTSQRAKADIGDLAKNPDFAKMDPLHQVLMGAQAGVQLPGEALGGPGKLRVVDPRNAGAMNGQEIGSKDKVVEIGYPPQAPQMSTQWIGNDEKGNPLTAANRLDATGKPIFIRSDGTRYEGPIAAKPTAGSGNHTKIDPRYMAALQKAAGDKSSKGEEQRKAAINGIIVGYDTTSRAKAAVQHILADPNRGDADVQTIMSRLSPSTLQVEKDAIQDILTAVLGQ